jgi:glycosyltransferase involved in cell wall biosynthesis
MTLWRTLSGCCAEPVQLLALREELATSNFLLRVLGRGLGAWRISALHLLFPLLLGRLRYRSVMLYQGPAFVHIPLLRLLGYRVLAICDAPPRMATRGLAGWWERTMPAFVRRASVVVRTYDFDAPYPPGPVVPDILEPFPQAPAAFSGVRIRRLLYVGRLQPEKGLLDLLRLAGEMPEYEFVVYGAGPLEPVVREACSRLGNLDYKGFSRAWREESRAGACLIGCAPAEASWTTGKEALLIGLPLLFVSSITGAPQRYRAYTGMAREVASLERALVLEAIERLNAAPPADRAPVWSLWEQNRPERLASAFADLCGVTVAEPSDPRK